MTVIQLVAVVLLAASLAKTVNAFTGSVARSSFVGRRAALTPAASSSAVSSGLRMDMETDLFDYEAARFSLEEILAENSRSHLISLEDVEAQHGMPWKSSIDPKVEDEELLYMPFWEWQMQYMKDNLTNLRVLPCSNGETDFAYNENTKKKARIVNLCFRSDEYKKIRMTYYDAGDQTQVFNAVWYPDEKYNLPILGIDLLAFNRKKYLAIVDFQPIHASEADHAVTFEDKLAPIKANYDNLKGQMSSKFYDETQFFSQQMLFARFDKEDIIAEELFPAFCHYVHTHVDMVQSTQPDYGSHGRTAVQDRHQAYDNYSAARDPATGLFAAMFGNDWAKDFVHDFLFSSSQGKEGFVIPPMPGAPPPAAAATAAVKGGVAAAAQPAMAQPIVSARRR